MLVYKYGRGSIIEEIGKEGIRKGMGIGSIWSSVEGVGVIIIMGMMIVGIKGEGRYRKESKIIGVVMSMSRSIIGRKEEKVGVEEVKKQLKEEKELWHPVMMLMGYVIQSMSRGKSDVRRREGREKSMLVVSIGIIMGGEWSMEIEGWGGYWSWDGVEKVSMIVWMMIISGIHSERNSRISRVEWGMSMYMSEKIGRGGIESIHSFVGRRGIREEWIWVVVSMGKVEGRKESKELSKKMIVMVMVLVGIGEVGMKSIVLGVCMLWWKPYRIMGGIMGGRGERECEEKVGGELVSVCREKGVHGVIGMGIMLVMLGEEEEKESKRVVNKEEEEGRVWLEGRSSKRSVIKEEVKKERIREYSEVRIEEVGGIIIGCMVAHWSNLKWYRCIRWR